MIKIKNRDRLYNGVMIGALVTTLGIPVIVYLLTSYRTVILTVDLLLLLGCLLIAWMIKNEVLEDVLLKRTEVDGSPPNVEEEARVPKTPKDLSRVGEREEDPDKGRRIEL